MRKEYIKAKTITDCPDCGGIASLVPVTETGKKAYVCAECGKIVSFEEANPEYKHLRDEVIYY